MARSKFAGKLTHDGTKPTLTMYDRENMLQRAWEELNGKVGQTMEVELTFRLIEPIIENWRRRYYRGYVVPPICKAANQTGQDWSNDDANEFLKRAYLKPKKDGTYTTVGLSDKAFGEFIEKCIHWGADFFGIDFTTPQKAGLFPEAEL